MYMHIAYIRFIMRYEAVEKRTLSSTSNGPIFVLLKVLTMLHRTEIIQLSIHFMYTLIYTPRPVYLTVYVYMYISYSEICYAV